MESRRALLALALVLATVLCAHSQIAPSKPTQIVIQTSPNAEVYLDNTRKGQANSKGYMVIDRVTPGNHLLRVSLAGRQNYEQTVKVMAGQTARVEARLEDIVPPRPAPGPTQLVIDTSPSAEVYLDDVFRGRASSQGRLVIDPAKPGDHTLRISLPGKQNYEQKVAVIAGQAARVEAVLEDIGPPPTAPGQLEVESSPGAEVYLDDIFRGRASAEGHLVIPHPTPGDHALRVSLPGKKDFEQNVTVAPGQVKKITAVPADLAATVVVQTSPGAAVFLDDSPLGTSDGNGKLSLGEVAAGAHALRITAPGKVDYRQDITVLGGQAVTVGAPLMEAGGTVMVRTSPGAEIFIDNTRRGKTDSSGQWTVPGVAAGEHALRVSARGKRDTRLQITVSAGKEFPVVVLLADLAFPLGTVKVNPQDGLKYVWIQPGSFEMGCSRGDNECSDEEKPAHRVTLTRGFWIGQTDVTVGAYKRFAGATGREMPGAPNFNGAWANENMPIVNASWNEAHDYCAWAGGRLPTEAEWEYAARGGDAQERYGNIGDIAWYSKNSQGQVHEVAQLHANKFGLYDMLGNVWEWVNDWYGPGYYQNSPSQDPSGPTSGSKRLMRGGSWSNYPGNIRVSYRSSDDPAMGNAYVGFRCGGEGIMP
jgi:formylglycine-generating enzyme required for sulfatase activity